MIYTRFCCALFCCGDISSNRIHLIYIAGFSWVASLAMVQLTYSQIPLCTWMHFRTEPTMRLSHIPQCTIQNRNVHISVLNGVLWDVEQVLWVFVRLVCSIPDASEAILKDTSKIGRRKAQCKPCRWLYDVTLVCGAAVYHWYHSTITWSSCFLIVSSEIKHMFGQVQWPIIIRDLRSEIIGFTQQDLKGLT